MPAGIQDNSKNGSKYNERAEPTQRSVPLFLNQKDLIVPPFYCIPFLSPRTTVNVISSYPRYRSEDLQIPSSTSSPGA